VDGHGSSDGGDAVRTIGGFGIGGALLSDLGVGFAAD
jgi:hypothetical protein